MFVLNKSNKPLKFKANQKVAKISNPSDEKFAYLSAQATPTTLLSKGGAVEEFKVNKGIEAFFSAATEANADVFQAFTSTSNQPSN